MFCEQDFGYEYPFFILMSLLLSEGVRDQTGEYTPNFVLGGGRARFDDCSKNPVDLA